MSLPNRLARSATAERGADDKGRVIPELIELYRALASGGVGLIMTGHAYVRRDGRTSNTMTGAHSDDMIPGLSKIAKVAHKNSDACIFLQINHIGRAASAEMIGSNPIAPSSIPVKFSRQRVRQLSSDETEELVEDYALAALRAQEAGFDGVQLHCAHGYLISQFLSPYTNKREDKWGGSSENRRRFLFNIVSEIKDRAPDFPITIKINCEDFVPGGFTLEEFAETCLQLEGMGVEAIEVSAGIPESAGKIVRRNIRFPEEEGYLLYGARALKDAGVKIPVLTVGGYRTKHICQDVLERNEADIISLSRPLITEPDLPRKWREGESGKSRCVSCSKCLMLKNEITHCVYWEKEKT